MTREQQLEQQLRDVMLELMGIMRTASVLYQDVQRMLYGDVPLVGAGEQRAELEREEGLA